MNGCRARGVRDGLLSTDQIPVDTGCWLLKHMHHAIAVVFRVAHYTNVDWSVSVIVESSNY